MNKKNIHQRLQGLWDKGIERAAEDSPREDALDSSSWHEAEGFLTRTGLKGGSAPGKPTAQASLCTLYCGRCG